MLHKTFTPWAIPALAIIAAAIADPAAAQWSGRSSLRRPPPRPIDPAVILRQFDANQDGLLAPDEIPDRARQIVERAAEQAKLNLDEPISIEQLAASIKQQRTGQPGGETPSSEQDNGSSPAATGGGSAGVAGFGVETDLAAVPGFGPVAADQAIGVSLDDRYESRVIEYVNRIFSRYDKNQNELLDQDEWQDISWRSDPKESDSNSDGRLSKMEFCERMVKQWNWGRRDRAAGTVAARTGTTGFGAASAGPSESDSDGGKVRRYAESLVKQYDENRNGVLEKDEWAKMRGNPERADVNNDGQLSLDELAAHLASYGKESSSRRSSTVASSSASPSRSNPASSRTTSGQPAYRFKSPMERLPRGLPDWFPRSDTNGDGQIAMFEYSATWSDDKAEEFSRFDLNGDGLITPAECLAVEQQK